MLPRDGVFSIAEEIGRLISWVCCIHVIAIEMAKRRLVANEIYLLVGRQIQACNGAGGQGMVKIMGFRKVEVQDVARQRWGEQERALGSGAGRRFAAIQR